MLILWYYAWSVCVYKVLQFELCVFTGLLHAETGMLVLAGDPKQLGPILRSPYAIKYGLGEMLSFIHFILSLSFYPVLF